MRLLLSQSFRLGIALWLCSAMAAAAEPTNATGRRSQSPRNVAIFVFQGMELLDFAGPGEVFEAAGTQVQGLYCRRIDRAHRESGIRKDRTRVLNPRLP